MQVQRILRGARIAALRQRIKDDDSLLDLYATAPSFSEISENDWLLTPIRVPDAPPVLRVTPGSVRDLASEDAENAILVYSYLPDLTRSQAADARLWATLAHTTFWGYVRARWGASNRDALRNAVLRHWFVPEGGGKAALRTQAISRLWWAAYLTCAPWERDPALAVFKTADRFRFTRILVKRQQIYFDLIERDFGSDLRLRTCFLDALDRHMPSVNWRDAVSREASKQINLILKHRQFTGLSVDDIRRVCDEVVAAVVRSLSRESCEAVEDA